jgi:hypothetical protein
MIRKKIIIIYFIIISLIIILVMLSISKDKYKKDDRQLNQKIFLPSFKVQNFKKHDQCSSSLPISAFNIKGKLKASAQSEFVFRAKQNRFSRNMEYPTLYVEFINNPDSNITKLFTPANVTTKMINGYECLTISAPTNYPEKYAILDPLEKNYLHFDPSSPDYPTQIKDAIKEIVQKRWVPFIAIDIQFIDPTDPFIVLTPSDMVIKIRFDHLAGNKSFIGSDCCNKERPWTMNFSSFSVRKVLHEFGHALGLIHEHQSPLAGGIPPRAWNRPQLMADNVETFKENNLLTLREQEEWILKNVIILHDTANLEKGTYFDEKSIMIYQFDPNVFTLAPWNRTGTRDNQILSFDDVIFISRLYPKYDEDTNKIIPVDVREVMSIYYGHTMYPFLTP